MVGALAGQLAGLSVLPVAPPAAVPPLEEPLIEVDCPPVPAAAAPPVPVLVPAVPVLVPAVL